MHDKICEVNRLLMCLKQRCRKNKCTW